MINLMNMRVIKDKLSEEAAVIVANDRVYWKCYSEDCIEEIQESPIEWLNQPWGVDRMSIAIYANSCSKGFSVTIGGDGNVVAIHGHKKIRVIITGMENFVESEDENALISVVEDYNYHNYAHGKFLKRYAVYCTTLTHRDISSAYLTIKCARLSLLTHIGQVFGTVGMKVSSIRGIVRLITLTTGSP